MYYNPVDNLGQCSLCMVHVWTFFVYVFNLCVVFTYQIVSMPTLALGLAKGWAFLLTCINLVQVNDSFSFHKVGGPTSMVTLYFSLRTCV